MTPARWRQVQDILDRVVAAPPGARERVLDTSCDGDVSLRREVAALADLIDDPTTTPLDRPIVPEPWCGSVADSAVAHDPVRVGAYRLAERIGRGGMGDVYLARRDDGSYQQRVAVKVLHQVFVDPEGARRFESERQILADLDHPNIAKLLDGGTADDGRPFLVMELVEGLPIDQHCRSHQLDVRARLDLFARVCQAVQYAHQSLVVHRDLKPDNILVDDAGEPKLLDFGVAKLLPNDAQSGAAPTIPGLLPLTPEYASPEQVRGDPVGTTTDVYALGVLLFELLSGSRPYRLDRRRPRAAIQAICEERPPRPSQVVDLEAGGLPDRSARQLRGDLDSIVSKALRKTPSDRYSSAADLARDLGRHLEGLPVAARGDGARYRLGKFVARHRFGVAITVLAVLASATFVSTLVRQRSEILAQQARSEQVIDFMTELFALPDPNRASAESLTVREVLERGARDIEAGLVDQPRVRADLSAAMGRTFRNLGLYPEAERQLTRSLSLRSEMRGRATELARARELFERGNVRLAKVAYEEATADGLASLAIRRQRHGDEHVDVAWSRVLLGRIYTLSGRWDEAGDELTQAVTIARTVGSPAALTDALDRLAQLRSRQGRFGEATQRHREALEVATSHFGADHPTVALVLNNYSVTAEELGETAQVRTLLEESERIQRARYDGPHPYLATTLHNLGVLYQDHDQWDRAKAVYDEALSMRKALYQGPHPAVASTQIRLALLAQHWNEWDEAERLLLDSIEILEATVDEHDPRRAQGYEFHARLLVRLGELDRAEPLYERSLEIRRKALGPGHPHTVTTMIHMADLTRRRRDFADAIAQYRTALRLAHEAYGGEHPNIARILYRLGKAQRLSGDLEAATASLHQAERRLRMIYGEEHSEVTDCMLLRAVVAIDDGRAREAEALTRQVATSYRRGAPDPNQDANVASVLGVSLLEQGRYAEAEPLLVSSYQHYVASQGPQSNSAQVRLEQLHKLYDAWGRPEMATALPEASPKIPVSLDAG